MYKHSLVSTLNFELSCWPNRITAQPVDHSFIPLDLLRSPRSLSFSLYHNPYSTATNIKSTGKRKRNTQENTKRLKKTGKFSKTLLFHWWLLTIVYLWSHETSRAGWTLWAKPWVSLGWQSFSPVPFLRWWVRSFSFFDSNQSYLIADDLQTGFLHSVATGKMSHLDTEVIRSGNVVFGLLRLWKDGDNGVQFWSLKHTAILRLFEKRQLPHVLISSLQPNAM
jgi:hypothetical protein